MGPRIVIAGGGFGGLYTALYLAESSERPRGTRITLLDQRNFFTFTPLLTEVASGALGGAPRFFGLERVQRVAMPFQTLRQALALRNRVVGLVERLQHTADEAARRAMMTIVIAGGGPAGTEVASELRHLLCAVAPNYYRIDVPVRIVLAEAGPEILPQFEPELASEGHRVLADRGVDIRTGVRVSGHEAGDVILSDGARIRADTLVWTAGVGPSSVIAESGLPRSERGGVVVDDYLRVQGHPDIYAVGDCNHIMNPRTDRSYPNVAPIAINQGMRAAGNIENDIVGRSLEPYEAHYAGKIVSLGAGAALVETLGFRWSGRPAWWMYRLVYLLKLVGTKPKIRVAVTLALNKLFEPDLSYETEAGEPLPGSHHEESAAAGEIPVDSRS